MTTTTTVAEVETRWRATIDIAVGHQEMAQRLERKAKELFAKARDIEKQSQNMERPR